MQQLLTSQLKDGFRSTPTDSNPDKFPLVEPNCLSAAIIAYISMNLSNNQKAIAIFS